MQAPRGAVRLHKPERRFESVDGEVHGTIGYGGANPSVALICASSLDEVP